jgi:mannose-1-phosphate guanylyltransferase
MIVVIIAGGSGTRLWPLSTPTYPKHLLKVHNQSTSLLQATYRRARKLAENVYIVSEVSHIEHVKLQLPELPEESFIVEPGRRGTANCILAALQYIGNRHDPNEEIAFIHSDHYIRDTAGFLNSLKLASVASRDHNRLVLVGVEPTYPATGFGYIQKGELLESTMLIYSVSSFKEKPDLVTAKKYFESGDYLWNCGYFVGSHKTFLAAMEHHAPDLFDNYRRLVNSSQADYEPTYLALSPEAIDYALIEKMPDLLVAPATFDWMDLGSYADLHQATGSDEQGNAVVGRAELEAVENSFIQNQEDKPLVVIGLDNIVVINTPAGILVARQDVSQKVGDVSKRFSEDQPPG